MRRSATFVTLILAAGAGLLTACDGKSAPQRKQQVVKLLPDTPPPPPPPPKPEERTPPKPDDKPQPQEVQKAMEAPQPQALKSDEAAGDGPGNGLSAGSVTQDYTDQKLGQGSTIGGAPAENPTARLALNSYANAATRALNEYLSRDKDVKRLDYKVRVEVWLTPSGQLERAVLLGSTGDAPTDEALRAALTRFPGTGQPPPPKLPQPLRVLVTNRMLG
jgi:protein TonB